MTKDILCVGQEETYEFIKNLLTEVCELFPYEYFHIGGDEAFKGHKIWEKECPVCQAKMKELGFTKGSELQTYFNNRISDYLKTLGKKCIEWNDGISDNTNKDIVGQYWITRTPLWVKNECEKRKYIVSTCPTLYFDYTYSMASLKKVYNFNVVKSGFINENSVLGVEFESWSEWIVNESAWQFAVYPRIFAFAEVAWTEDEKKNYKDFYKRLDFFKAYMCSKNINYSRIEKKKLFLRNKSVFHLGSMGVEYKKNEEIKKMNNTK
ncbi:MAG: family 20 glycosylhydrolase [Clostridia bacterium]|nr:family 20 glycosylhydrolase [Clostridia bacterium]